MMVMTIIAVSLLVLHWRGPNAVWGTVTLGVIVGLIISLVTKDWSKLALCFTVGTFIGTFFEWMGRIANKWKK